MKLRWEILARSIHRWLTVLIGIQILIWFVSGFVMSFLNMDDVHGDHLVRKAKGRIALEKLIAIQKLEAGSEIREIKIKLRGDFPIYIVREESRERIFDALNGSELEYLKAAEVQSLAGDYLAQPATPTRVELVQTPLQEFKGEYPVYRLDFDKPEKFSLYLSPLTGELLSIRNQRWRIYDFFWMLHIMDYSQRENVNTPWLRVLAFLSVFVAATGFLLAFVWLRLSWRRRANRPQFFQTR